MHTQKNTHAFNIFPSPNLNILNVYYMNKLQKYYIIQNEKENVKF